MTAASRQSGLSAAAGTSTDPVVAIGCSGTVRMPRSRPIARIGSATAGSSVAHSSRISPGSRPTADEYERIAARA